MDFKPLKVITSIKNPQLQFLRSLMNDRTTRSESELFVVEGVRLCEEAMQSNFTAQSVFYSSVLSPRGLEIIKNCQDSGIQCFELDPGTLNRISDTETAQGIMMTIPKHVTTLPPHADLVLILDTLRDPGNTGTILRSAAAVGVQVVFFTSGSVDPYMPKVVRSGMGAHFRLNIQQSNWIEIKRYCKVTQTPPLTIFLAESTGDLELWSSNLKHPLALVIGGEARGASPEAKEYADYCIHIPMPGQFESLNASVAASILLFEVIRQRSQ